MISGNHGTPVMAQHGSTTMKPRPSRALMRSIVKWAACIVTWLNTLPKFNSSPLKSYRTPIGKHGLPTIIFQGRAVKLQGVL